MLHNRPSMMILILIASVVLVATYPSVVFAQPTLIPQDGTIGGCSFITGDFGFDCIPLYLAYLIRLAFGLAGGFALFNIIQGGYEYAISGMQPIAGGLPDKEAAKKRITNAIVGFVVVVLAYLIIDTIVSAIFVG